MGMIYMQVKEVARRAEKWSIGMMGASIISNPIRREALQLSERNSSDGSTRFQTSELASRRGSISGNNNRGRSRCTERRNEAAWQAFLYVLAYAVTHIWAFVVFNIELGGGTNPPSLLLIENFFWPLQGLANVFISLRPRIQSIQKTSPTMIYFTAVYHSVFRYDEFRRRSLRTATSLDRPDEGSRPKSGTADISDSFPKSTGEESDTLATPSATPAGMNKCKYEHEESFQPAIYEESSADHDADEEPT